MMTRLAVFILWLLHFLPLRIQAAIGNTLGLLLYKVAGERRFVADTNLRLCFPQMPETERKRLVRENFQAFARSFIERGILWWSSEKRIRSLIHVIGWEHFLAAQDRPVIFLVPHFVGLDVAGIWSALHQDGVSIYSTQKNAYLTQLLHDKRGRFGKQLLYTRQQGLRPVIKALRDKRPFFYLPDQDQDIRDGAFIPFFGVQAATLTALPRLAEITNARVLPITVRLLPGAAGYELRYYPSWENYPTGDLIADTRRMNEFIEQRVLEMPEQYFWLHKRFKTRPEGEAALYPE